MLNRRELLKMTAAGMAVAASGLGVAEAATGKLVGHSFFCLFDVYDGRVAIEDIDYILLTQASFIRIHERLDQLHRAEARQLRNPRHDYGVAKMKDALMHRELLAADKLREREELDEIPEILWERGGRPFDSGGKLSDARLRKFAFLMNEDDYLRHMGYAG